EGGNDVGIAAIHRLHDDRSATGARNLRLTKPCSPCRTIRIQTGNPEPFLRLGDVRDADVAADHASVLNQFGNDAADQIDGDGEPDPGALPDFAAAGDGRVHPDQPAPRVQQGTARRTGIDRRIDLDDLFDDPV